MNTNHAVADLILKSDEPTVVSKEQLYRWVVWQFPRRFEGGLCAAIRPPLASFGWIPAVVLEDRIAVQAHLAEPFKSPEEAVAFLQLKTPVAQKG